MCRGPRPWLRVTFTSNSRTCLTAILLCSLAESQATCVRSFTIGTACWFAALHHRDNGVIVVSRDKSRRFKLDKAMADMSQVPSHRSSRTAQGCSPTTHGSWIRARWKVNSEAARKKMSMNMRWYEDQGAVLGQP